MKWCAQPKCSIHDEDRSNCFNLTKRSYTRLSLETGSVPGFEPALRLYTRFGFTRCGPFADYPEDPYSVFMTMAL